MKLKKILYFILILLIVLIGKLKGDEIRRTILPDLLKPVHYYCRTEKNHVIRYDLLDPKGRLKHRLFKIKADNPNRFRGLFGFKERKVCYPLVPPYDRFQWDVSLPAVSRNLSAVQEGCLYYLQFSDESEEWFLNCLKLNIQEQV